MPPRRRPRRGPLGAPGVAADDSHGRPLGDERSGHRPTEPRRRPEHERPCAGETEIHQVPSQTVRLTV